MQEICQSGSEGGGAGDRSPYPYSIGKPPHYDSFVFQRRGGVARLHAHSAYESHLRNRHRRAAEKQKKGRGVFGDYRHGAPDGAWASARCELAGAFRPQDTHRDVH